MKLSKEEYARKRIHNGSLVQIENSVTRVTLRHHLANSYPCDGIFSQHPTTIKDSYILPREKSSELQEIWPKSLFSTCTMV